MYRQFTSRYVLRCLSLFAFLFASGVNSNVRAWDAQIGKFSDQDSSPAAAGVFDLNDFLSQEFKLRPYDLLKEPPKEIVALIVSISRYKKNPIRSAPKDAHAMRELFLKNGVIGSNIKTMEDLSSVQLPNIITEIKNLGANINKFRSNSIIFYYSGHGIEVGSANYIIGTDSTFQGEKILSIDAIINAIQEAGFGFAYLIIDSCRSHQMIARPGISTSLNFNHITGFTANLADPVQLGMVSSTRTGSPALGIDDSRGNSIFTGAFYRSLLQFNLADMGENQFNDAIDRVRAELWTNYQQTPFTSEKSNKFPILFRRKPTTQQYVDWHSAFQRLQESKNIVETTCQLRKELYSDPLNPFFYWFRMMLDKLKPYIQAKSNCGEAYKEMIAYDQVLNFN